MHVLSKRYESLEGMWVYIGAVGVCSLMGYITVVTTVSRSFIYEMHKRNETEYLRNGGITSTILPWSEHVVME